MRTRVTRLARTAKVIGATGLVGLTATGCSVDEVLRFGWPTGITPQAERMRELWTWSTVAALVVGVLMWGLMLWPVVFHRKKSDELPRQTQYNLPLEVIYTGIPFVIILVLFYYAVGAQNFIDEQEAEPDVAVEVVGFQWNWEFRYPDERTSDGEVVSTVGSSEVIPLLVLPTERVIEYRISAKDVLHSFFVPEFLFKRDMFPRPEKNNTDNVFQNTIDRPGAFVGRCAELCGTYHAMMNFEVRALEPDLYDRYIELRRTTNPATAVPYTAGEALAELDCGELCTPTAITTRPFDTRRDANTFTGGSAGAAGGGN
ncbi:MAG TPA: cytochrome c oxidase subunit II [Pseudonocardiaceae bacterium]